MEGGNSRFEIVEGRKERIGAKIEVCSSVVLDAENRLDCVSEEGQEAANEVDATHREVDA